MLFSIWFFHIWFSTVFILSALVSDVHFPAIHYMFGEWCLSLQVSVFSIHNVCFYLIGTTLFDQMWILIVSSTYLDGILWSMSYIYNSYKIMGDINCDGACYFLNRVCLYFSFWWSVDVGQPPIYFMYLSEVCTFHGEYILSKDAIFIQEHEEVCIGYIYGGWSLICMFVFCWYLERDFPLILCVRYIAWFSWSP